MKYLPYVFTKHGITMLAGIQNAPSVKEKTKNFLKADYINKEILFDIVNRIEIDENKKVYIHFNFEQLNIYGVEVDNNVSIS